MKFRKKPVVIEAIKYQAELGNNRVMNWLALQGANIHGWLFFYGEITIPTLEGSMKVSDGDWIIKGTKGEFYPCKPDIFVEIYEEQGSAEEINQSAEIARLRVQDRRIKALSSLISRGLPVFFSKVLTSDCSGNYLEVEAGGEIVSGAKTVEALLDRIAEIVLSKESQVSQHVILEESENGNRKDSCPHCGVGLVSAPIPEEYRVKGGYGDATHWRREIAIYSPAQDRTVAWRCPDCNQEWMR